MNAEPRIAIKHVSILHKEAYRCKYDWPADCELQCGDNGIVFVQGGRNYRTAFFEAFPASPQTFIRGEGASIEEAEEKAWSKFQRILSCPGHEFEPREGYAEGVGVCKNCRLVQSGVFGSADADR